MAITEVKTALLHNFASDPNPQVITVGAVPVGTTIVIMTDVVITGIVDSRGNTYTSHSFDFGSHVIMHDAFVTTALQAGDTITITRSGGAFCRYVISFFAGLDKANPYFYSQWTTYNPGSYIGNAWQEFEVTRGMIPRDGSLSLRYFIGSSFGYTTGPALNYNTTGWPQATVFASGTVSQTLWSIGWEWGLSQRSNSNGTEATGYDPAHPADNGWWSIATYQPAMSLRMTI